MKALSIQQPWAWAILHAGKDIENRSWPTKHRGPVLIHAGQRWDEDGFVFLRLRLGLEVPIRNDFARGGIVGSVTIADCVTSSASRWFFGEYGFVLRDAKPLELPGGRRIIPMRGALGLFDVPNDVSREAMAA